MRTTLEYTMLGIKVVLSDHYFRVQNQRTFKVFKIQIPFINNIFVKKNLSNMIIVKNV
jgi:hypothetical protein